jgi:hypothetical protein
MNKIIIGAIATLAFGAAAVATVVVSGVINIGADVPHSPLVHKAIAFGRERSIDRNVAGINVPDDIANSERIRRGAGNYDAMCVNCHLTPELPDTEIRKGLYPTPPNLAQKNGSSGVARSPARDFWIIKHGIKASGMPAWSRGGMDDESIWDMAAFLQRLPGLAKRDYELLVAASDGHSHGGLDEHGHGDHASPPAVMAAPTSANPSKELRSSSVHDHSTHKH